MIGQAQNQSGPSQTGNMASWTAAATPIRYRRPVSSAVEGLLLCRSPRRWRSCSRDS